MTSHVSLAPESPPSICTPSPSLRRLSDILGIDDDPSLRIVSVSVRDNVVQIKLLGADGAHVKHYFAEEALRVVTELIGWSKGRNGAR